MKTSIGSLEVVPDMAILKGLTNFDVDPVNDIRRLRGIFECRSNTVLDETLITIEVFDRVASPVQYLVLVPWFWFLLALCAVSLGSIPILPDSPPYAPRWSTRAHLGDHPNADRLGLVRGDPRKCCHYLILGRR